MSEVFDVAPFAKTLATIDKSSDIPAVPALQKPSLLTVLYTPRDLDKQQPHTTDEVYIVASGSAVLEVDGEQRRLGTGDAAFVAAQAQHHFASISKDFAVWAVFPVPVKS
ncbi:MAG: cupin domain-containing protein [Pseudomonadota bacterium]